MRTSTMYSELALHGEGIHYQSLQRLEGRRRRGKLSGGNKMKARPDGRVRLTQGQAGLVRGRKFGFLPFSMLEAGTILRETVSY